MNWPLLRDEAVSPLRLAPLSQEIHVTQWSWHRNDGAQDATEQERQEKEPHQTSHVGVWSLLQIWCCHITGAARVLVTFFLTLSLVQSLLIVELSGACASDCVCSSFCPIIDQWKQCRPWNQHVDHLGKSRTRDFDMILLG